MLVIGLSAPTAAGQVFVSGSDGSDGALNFTCPSPPCEVIFDPVALGLDLDDDNVFHFTTVTIPAGLTLRLSAVELNWAPVYWLASGAVQIDGTIDLSGEAGHDLLFRRRSIPGPGGFHGGTAFRDTETRATAGFGPGAGVANANPTFCNGNGAGYGTLGRSVFGGVSGTTYGNVFLLPLIGGSGGGGGACTTSRGGGAGGGALLIASSEFITVDGGIFADGGEAAETVGESVHENNGGGGSGGAIRLLAPVIDGSGSLSTAGGKTGSTVRSFGGDGRIRLEAFEHNFAGATTSLLRIMTLSPNAVFLPDGLSSVRVVTVDGVPASDRPSGSFVSTDFTINEANTVILTIEAKNVPLGTVENPTVVTLLVFPEALADIAVETTPLSGTFELSTASASVTFPHGFSRFTVRALWTP